MKKWIIVSFIAAVIAIAASAYIAWIMIERSDRAQEKLGLTANKLSQSSYRADSLSRALLSYSQYELVVRTMASRDQAIDSLMDWIGHDVLLYDSTVAICQGVYYGGDPFEFRVWCHVVRRSDGSELDVSPLLLRRRR
jgi:flagellar basal body-associated protein FliL